MPHVGRLQYTESDNAGHLLYTESDNAPPRKIGSGYARLTINYVYSLLLWYCIQTRVHNITEPYHELLTILFICNIPYTYANVYNSHSQVETIDIFSVNGHYLF